MIRAIHFGPLRHPWLADAGRDSGEVELDWVDSLEALRHALARGAADVVLLDADDAQGLAALRGAGGLLGAAALVLVARETDAARAVAHAALVGARDIIRPDASALELSWALHKARRSDPVPIVAPPQAEPTRPHLSALEVAVRRDLQHEVLPFTLHFQPRVELRSGQIVGAEALLRYAPADLGPVQTSELVALLESLDAIEAVGSWVLHEACRVSAAWERAGHPLVIGVNVSALQVASGRLDRVVDAALVATGASAELLELELTEGVLIDNTADARRVLGALRARGVRIAVDDFGTGYASLRYVKHFPMDAIKIDREFIQGLPGDVENVAITSAIVALAHRLHIEVVAEGVEHAAEEAFLRELGCDYVQGYLRARPMPASDLIALLRRRPAAVSQVNLLCREPAEEPLAGK